MQKRQIVALYIIVLIVLVFLWLWIWIFLDYQICEFFPDFWTCIPRIVWNKNYWYIFQEQISLLIILILVVIFSIVYWKIIKKRWKKFDKKV